MQASEIRELFLKYFEERGHSRVASSSLVPIDDPTLFFTNAGMVPFKEVFLGNEKRPYARACSSQKCMRVSGKHNDLENVGYTPRHHTFFEMLGNFSFGDYFKKEAIDYAWEFLTTVVNLPKERLYVTVFQDDDEAEKNWQKQVVKDRIFRRGEKDNFWAMGETGPCGPCSEIHWDWEPQTGKVTQKDFDGDRLFEIWNLVFMQFNRDASGKMEKLKKPCVDTGMGLERLACLLQGKENNYETDLFAPIIDAIKKITHGAPRTTRDEQIATQVIADHVRGASFLLADGVLPSNEGRGYVLRRILRRAIRYAKKLGVTQPILHLVSQTVVREMGETYPELKKNKALIEKALETEETHFLRTIDRGMEILEEEFKKTKQKTLSGNVVFKLYDTFGFPKDLTDLIAKERGFHIDEEGFEKEMEAQRERARAAWKGSGGKQISAPIQKIYQQGVRSRFVGYNKEKEESPVLQLIAQNGLVKRVSEGEEFELIAAQTPFYAEGGGQVGDIGSAYHRDAEIEILDTQKPYADLFLHHCRLRRGEVALQERLLLKIDGDRRRKIRSNHTATHLLHAALRQILGEHVKQAGSFLDDHHLRFDFSHFSQVTEEQLADIEALANKVIHQNLKVTTGEMPYPEAITKGALAFFGEKYGDVVRVIQIGDFSTELCGGTHVASTSDIGLIKIVKERSVASGVRRIEACTGETAKNFEKDKKISQKESAQTEKEKEIKRLEAKKEKSSRTQAAMDAIGNFEKELKTIKGIKVFAAQVPVADAGELRELADRLKQKIGSGIICLGADTGGKGALIIMVTKDLTSKYSAGNMMKQLAPLVGGTGGGRPDMAQGGGPDVAGLQKAIMQLIDFIG